MRIHSLYIEGFGVFHDCTVDGLGEGLNVFFGPNEAGKSTLLAFMRSVLFGFPRQRKGISLYPPLRGGRHGGRVTLLVGDGTAVVERFRSRTRSVRITLPSGAEGTEADVRVLLGGADERVFRTIFAFDLHELSVLENLKQEGISDRIFTAGITGAGGSARRAIEKIGKEKEHLLKPRSGQIRDALKALKALSVECTEAKKQAERFKELLAHQAELQESFTAWEQELQSLKHRREHLKKLRTLWPLWCERRDAEKELASLPQVEDIPEDAQEKLGELLGQRSRTEETLRKLKARVQVRERERAELTERCDRRLVALAQEVAEHAGELSAYRQNCAALSECEEQLSALQEQVNQALESLGRNWDPDRLMSVDTSGRLRRAVRGLAGAEEALKEARRRVEHCRQECQEVEQEKKHLAEQLPDRPPPSHEELRAEAALLEELWAGLADADRQRERIEAEEASLACRRSMYQRFSGRVKRGSLLGAYAVAGALLFFLAPVSFLGAFLLYKQAPAGAVGLCLCALGSVAGGVVVAGRSKRERQKQAAELTQESEELSAAESKLARRKRAMEELLDSLKERAASLGVSGALEGHSLRELFQSLEEKKETRRLFDQARAELAAAEKRARQRAEAHREAEGARREAEKRYQELLGAWNRAKEQAGIPAEVSPESLDDFLSRAESARSKLERLGDLRRRRENLRKAVRAWEERCCELLRGSGRPEGCDLGGEKLIEAFRDLSERCRQARESAKNLQHVERELRELKQEISLLEDQLAEIDGALRRLFQMAGAQHEAGFRKRFALWERRRTLTDTVQQVTRQLRRQVGAAEDLLRELTTGTVTAWEEEQRRTEERIAELSEQLEARRLELHDVKSRIHELSESADVPAKELAFEGARERLRRLLSKWAVYALAQGLMEETLSAFVRRRQPAVLKEASQFFSSVTGGSYRQVLVNEQQDLVVLSKTGERLTPPQLSRGTAEQLYLCLRLALAGEFSRRGAAVPLIMDDVLVNFDSQRARALAELLARIAGTQQILFFTCHSETVSLLKEKVPEARYFHMDPYGRGITWRLPLSERG